jgi:predicted nucleotidyltransferase component of viral defense system
MREPVRNIGASVRARLQNISRERNQTFQLVLTHYVLERLLYRLSQTQHRDRFVLKGAMLITKWFADPLRPTQDLDLLGFGDADPEKMVTTFREICAVPFDDAVVFDIEAVEIDRMREELEYRGLRIKTNATVDGARVRVVIDIGFGDATEPGLTEMNLPVLLDFPAPHLRAYARETVIAEKFQAMVALGRANSRMKDLYDIWVLSRTHEFKDDNLARAIAATFARRKTEIPSEPPDALTSAFAEDLAKIQQWNSFVDQVTLQPGSLAEVVRDLTAFLMPHAAAAITLTKVQGSASNEQAQ